MLTYRGYGLIPGLPFLGYGMAPYWMGGVPAEGLGPVPPQIEWRSMRRQTTSRNVFENWLLDLESALATGGWSLSAIEQPNGVIYKAGDRIVAQAIVTQAGFFGTIMAEPVGRLHTVESISRMEYDAMLKGAYEGYRGYGNPGENGGSTGAVVGGIVTLAIVGGVGYLLYRYLKKKGKI